MSPLDHLQETDVQQSVTTPASHPDKFNVSGKTTSSVQSKIRKMAFLATVVAGVTASQDAACYYDLSKYQPRNDGGMGGVGGKGNETISSSDAASTTEMSASSNSVNSSNSASSTESSSSDSSSSESSSDSSSSSVSSSVSTGTGGSTCPTDGNLLFTGESCYEYEVYRGGIFLPPPQASTPDAACVDTDCSVNTVSGDIVVFWNSTKTFSFTGPVNNVVCECSSYSAAPQKAEVVLELNTAPAPTTATDLGSGQNHTYTINGCGPVSCMINE